MTDSLNVLWLEKYRPRTFDQMALSPEDRTLLKGCVEKGEIPHFLFSGPPGTGKTTTAKILLDNLDCQALILNASDERGIDTVRNKVGTFARTQSLKKWNIVFLDEADQLTQDAQATLRNMIETYAETCRFILTCNYLHKIIPPIQSRLMRIEMVQIPVAERFRILFNILAKEGVATQPPIVASYAQRYSDLRKMISAAQRCVLSRGQLEPVSQVEVGGLDFLNLIRSKNWPGCRDAAALPGFDPQFVLREMFWGVEDNFPMGAEWRMRIGRCLRDTQTAPDPIIDFLALCNELMTVQ